MRPPEFWSRTEGRDAAPVIRALLTPLGWAYAAAGEHRLRSGRAVSVSVPVVCIGNVTLGGVGKTPVARAVAAWLERRGWAAHILLRGYGGRARGPLRVDPAAHDASDVGDEALLHARDRPTWVARDRGAGALAAIAAGADILVMDDGFQNPSLRKDASLLVFDAETGLGNGRVFPAGPLRERLRGALARAQGAVLMLPSLASPLEAAFLEGFAPVLRAALEPLAPPPEGPLVAFAGIGRPAKFVAALERAGARIVETVPFPDHHPFTLRDLAFLDRLAQERGARLITTEKDHVRLPAPWREKVAQAPVAARFADEAQLDEVMTRLLPPLARPREAG